MAKKQNGVWERIKNSLVDSFKFNTDVIAKTPYTTSKLASGAVKGVSGTVSTVGDTLDALAPEGPAKTTFHYLNKAYDGIDNSITNAADTTTKKIGEIVNVTDDTKKLGDAIELVGEIGNVYKLGTKAGKKILTPNKSDMNIGKLWKLFNNPVTRTTAKAGAKTIDTAADLGRLAWKHKGKSTLGAGIGGAILLGADYEKNRGNAQKKLKQNQNTKIENGKLKDVRDLWQMVNRGYGQSFSPVMDGQYVIGIKNGKKNKWTIKNGYAIDLGPIGDGSETTTTTTKTPTTTSTTPTRTTTTRTQTTTNTSSGSSNNRSSNSSGNSNGNSITTGGNDWSNLRRRVGPTAEDGSSVTYRQGDDTNEGSVQFKKTGKEYIDNANAYGEKVSEIEMNAGRQKQDLVKGSNEEIRSRLAQQEELIGNILQEYRGATGQRRQELAQALQEQRTIAAREANSQYALAGANGYQFSESERNNFKQDVLSKYARNINEATLNNIRENMNLDNSLKELGFRQLAEQRTIDTFYHELNQKENEPMLLAIDEAKKGNLEAQKDIKDYFGAFLKEKADAEFKRAMSDQRLADNAREYARASTEKKLGMLNSLLFSVPGFNGLGMQVAEYVNSHPNEPLETVMLGLKAMADRYNQRNILSNSLAGKSYNDLSESEKILYNDKLGFDYTPDLNNARSSETNVSNNSYQEINNNSYSSNNGERGSYQQPQAENSFLDNFKQRLENFRGKTIHPVTYNKMLGIMAKRGISQNEIDKLLRNYSVKVSYRNSNDSSSRNNSSNRNSSSSRTNSSSNTRSSSRTNSSSRNTSNSSKVNTGIIAKIAKNIKGKRLNAQQRESTIVALTRQGISRSQAEKVLNHYAK